VQEASLHTNNQIFEEEDAVELNSILEPPAWGSGVSETEPNVIHTAEEQALLQQYDPKHSVPSAQEQEFFFLQVYEPPETTEEQTPEELQTFAQ